MDDEGVLNFQFPSEPVNAGVDALDTGNWDEDRPQGEPQEEVEVECPGVVRFSIQPGTVQDWGSEHFRTRARAMARRYEVAAEDLALCEYVAASTTRYLPENLVGLRNAYRWEVEGEPPPLVISPAYLIHLPNSHLPMHLRRPSFRRPPTLPSFPNR